MAKRSKSLQRYASGGNPRYSTLDAGLTAMRQQSDTQIRQLEKLSSQRERQDNIFLDSFKGKLSREADNRKEKYEVEVLGPRKMRADALEKNNQRLQERFKQRIKEQDDLAETWGELAPSLAKASKDLWNASRGFIDTRAAADEYDKLIRNGNLDQIKRYYSRIDKEGQKIFGNTVEEFTARLAQYQKTGDINKKQEAEVLLHQLKTKNPKLRDKLVADIKADIDSIVRDTISMLEDPESENPLKVDHKNVASIIQYRGIEVLTQLGINPKSKAGLDIQKAFRDKGLQYEQQYTLGYEYNRDSKVVNDSVDLIKVSHQNNDYEGANNNWKIMNSTYSSLPVESRAGNWSTPINVNPKESFKELAIELMYNPRYANNWTLYSEEVLGKNAANEFGYVIVNPEGDINKKHNRILGKHPNLESELLIEWGRIHDATKKVEEKSIQAKQAADASEFIDNLNSGYYRKTENQGKLWSDFDKYKNNPVAIAAMGRSLNFSDDSLDGTLLQDTLFRSLRSGDTDAIVSAWFTTNESNQEINYAYQNFNELALLLNQPLNKLDNKLLKLNGTKLDTLIKDNPLSGGKVRHYSVNGIDQEMSSFIVTYFVENRDKYETASQTYAAATAQLDSMLGINPDGTLQKPENGIRGFGQFAHRVGTTGDNRVVFLSKVGTIYNNTSSGEIEATLDGDFASYTTNEAKINYLLNAVANEAKDSFTDTDLLEVFNADGHPPNHPILEQIYPHLKKLNLTRKEFLDQVGRVRSGAEGRKLFCQMTGTDWCDNTYGTLHIKNPNDKLMQTAFSEYRKQLGLEPWEAAMLGSSNLKVRDYIINKLKQRRNDD